MSAYIVDKNHILYLVLAADSRRICKDGFRYFFADQWHSVREGGRTALAELGNILYRENIRSVSHRYPSESSATLPGPIFPDTVLTTADVSRSPWLEFDPVQVLCSIKCLNYQSCECHDWEQSEAFAILDALKENCIRALPGYDKATWGAPETQQQFEARFRAA